MKKIYAIYLPILLIAAVWGGCSGDITPPAGGSNYHVEAILVKKTLPDSAAFFMTLKKNNVVYKIASVRLSGIVIDTNQYGYVKHFAGAQFPVDSSYTLNIKDDSLDVNLTLALSGGFAINSPGLRTFTGSAEPVSWTVSTNSDGYILATLPPDTTVYYDAYEAYVSITQGTIPPEFFLDGLNRIVGTHMIYVAAYIGAPIDFYELPFVIPDLNNPGDNLSRARLSGRLAGMVIAAPDWIVVLEAAAR